MTLSTKSAGVVALSGVGALALWGGVLNAGLQPMSEQDMAGVTGQAGLTINGDLVMKGDPTDGSSSASTCPELNCFDMSLKNPGDDNFLVLDDARIDMGISNITLDADGAYTTTQFGADSVTPAVVIGLPDRLEVRDSQIGAVTVAWNETATETVGRFEQAIGNYQLRIGQDANFGTYDHNNNIFGSNSYDWDKGFWQTVVTGAAPITNLSLENVTGANAAYTQNTATQGTWTWDTGDDPGTLDPDGDADGDFAHTVTGTFYPALLRVGQTGPVTVDVTTSGGGNNNEPNPYIRIIDRSTGEDAVPKTSGGATAVSWSGTLGYPEAQIANRDLLSIDMDGGFSMNGNIVVMPK